MFNGLCLPAIKARLKDTKGLNVNINILIKDKTFVIILASFSLNITGWKEFKIDLEIFYILFTFVQNYIKKYIKLH